MDCLEQAVDILEQTVLIHALTVKTCKYSTVRTHIFPRYPSSFLH